MRHRVLVFGMILIGVGGCFSARQPSSVPSSNPGAVSPPGIQYGGGDGSSMEKAILVTGAKGQGDGVHAEYQWLKQHFPDYKLTTQSEIMSADGKSYDLMEISTAEGKKREIWFDITNFAGSF